MARYTGPKTKISRRFGEPIYGPDKYLDRRNFPPGQHGPKRRKKAGGPLGIGPQGRGRFNNAEPTIWNGEDLDIPTFLRRNISLDV